MSVEPVEHQHDDGTWHPGVGARDCDECAAALAALHNRPPTPFQQKNVLLSATSLTLARYKDRGWAPDSAKVKLARDWDRLSGIVARSEKAQEENRRYTTPKSEAEVVKEAMETLAGRDHLRGETPEWEAD